MNELGLIDLRSDTVTHPTLEMREAMLRAEVGDDVYHDDATTNELERYAAEILGKEAALFVPSGTMGNQLGVLVHTQRGQEIVLGSAAHIFMHEVGGAAVLAGVSMKTINFAGDIPEPAKIATAIRPDDIHQPDTGLICMENALSNGRVVPLPVMQEVAELAASWCQCQGYQPICGYGKCLLVQGTMRTGGQHFCRSGPLGRQCPQMAQIIGRRHEADRFSGCARSAGSAGYAG